jgi:hypothetical protein
MAQSPAPSSERPPAHGGARRLAAELFGVAAGPAAWIAQLVIDYGLSSYACYGGSEPRPAAPPASEHLVLLLINLACLALALSGLAISFASWRRPGAGGNRSRFLALCGLLSSAMFCVAILFDTPSALALRLCWSAPS